MMSLRLTLIGLFLVVHCVFVGFWGIAGSLYYFTEFYGPKYKFAPRVRGAILEPCKNSSVTLQDLTVEQSVSNSNVMRELVKTYGAVVLPSVLTKETVQAFRKYVLKASHEQGEVSKGLYHVVPPPTEPSAHQVIKEVANNSVLKTLLDDLLGDVVSPSLVRFSVVTSEYGTETQDWRREATLSAATYPEYFVPEYTLAIALQDITSRMGPIGACPQTQFCSGFSDDPKTPSHDCPSPMTTTLREGDAFVYNMDLILRGVGHSDVAAPSRAIAYLTFAASRQGPDDKRSLPLGAIHALDFRWWGETFDSMSVMSWKSWNIWRTLSVFNGKSTGQPWNLLDAILLMFGDSGEPLFAIPNHVISSRSLSKFADDMLFLYGFFATIAYIATTLYIMFLLAKTDPNTRMLPWKNGKVKMA